MDAAREAGAGGGTVVKARGTGGEENRKFFGFSIAEEKELHLIVTPAQGRNPIMKAIMEKAGMVHSDKTETIEYRGKIHICVYYHATI